MWKWCKLKTQFLKLSIYTSKTRWREGVLKRWNKISQVRRPSSRTLMARNSCTFSPDVLLLSPQLVGFVYWNGWLPKRLWLTWHYLANLTGSPLCNGYLCNLNFSWTYIVSDFRILCDLLLSDCTIDSLPLCAYCFTWIL